MQEPPPGRHPGAAHAPWTPGSASVVRGKRASLQDCSSARGAPLSAWPLWGAGGLLCPHCCGAGTEAGACCCSLSLAGGTQLRLLGSSCQCSPAPMVEAAVVIAHMWGGGSGPRGPASGSWETRGLPRARALRSTASQKLPLGFPAGGRRPPLSSEMMC